MNAIYNSATRQAAAIRKDLDAYSASAASPPALQGQLTTSLTAFARAIDEYTRALALELVAAKADKATERLAAFRSQLADYRARFAALKLERDHAQLSHNRSELLGRRPHAAHTPENPYAAAALATRPATGQNVNPLFRSSAADLQPGQRHSGYSSYPSPYGPGSDAQREKSVFGSANAALDGYLERGRDVLANLGEQREMLKGSQRKLYSIGTTLGISGDTIRMVERRARQDKWVFWGGVVVLVVFVYFVLRWVR